MTQYDVTDVCQEIRKCFERMLAISGGSLPHGKGIADVIAVAVRSIQQHLNIVIIKCLTLRWKTTTFTTWSNVL
jgi:hypothetical protein